MEVAKMTKKVKPLEKRIKEWEATGRKKEEVTYGMLGDGFKSISGIPDDFYSAEDPGDRSELWHEHRMKNDPVYEREQYSKKGWCWHCGSKTGCWCD